MRTHAELKKNINKYIQNRNEIIPLQNNFNKNLYVNYTILINTKNNINSPHYNIQTINVHTYINTIHI